jgi:diguanylate cyclase (GGDEF)-like protein/PAS domain S-box-containing protein
MKECIKTRFQRRLINVTINLLSIIFNMNLGDVLGMNVLSLISFFNAYSFIILGVYILKLNHKEIINKLAASVNFCVAIWALAYTFFFDAPTASSAMFWHRMSSPGWILFTVFTTHFFLVISQKTKQWRGIKWYILLYAIPVILLVKALLSLDSPIAKGVVQSKIGWGWTYNSNIGSIWFYLYFLYIITYHLVSFYIIYQWAKKSNRHKFLRQARNIILFEIVMIMMGCFTDLILPAISPIIPPVSILSSIFWGIGFFYIVRTYKIVSVYDVASADLILKTVMDPIIMLDSNGIIIACNHATEELFKYKSEHIINKPLYYFLKSKKYDEEKFKTLLNEKVLLNVEIDLVDSTGKIINSLVSFSIAESRLDGAVGAVLNIHDITELKKVEKELYKGKEKYKELSLYFDKLANYDKLTDIPNRRLFFDKFKLALEDYERSGNKFALIFIDLDGFKPINDCYGHDIGDLILINVAKRLLSSIRKQDIVARIGGDEFVIILHDLQEDSELDNIIQRINERFTESIIIGNIICPLGISLGISKCPEDGITIDELMKIADERMYKDKSLKNMPKGIL